MLKALKQELFRLSRSLPLLLAVLLIAFLSIIRWYPLHPDGQWRFDLEDDAYLYNSEDEFSAWIEYRFKGHRLSEPIDFEEAIGWYGLEGSEAATLHELYVDFNRSRYPLTFWYGPALFVPVFLLPTVLIGLGKRGGAAALAARLGGSGRRVALAKLLVFYAVFLIIDLLGLLIAQASFLPYGAGQYSFGYRLLAFLLRFALDLGLVSIPLWLAFRLRSPVLVTVVNLLLAAAFCLFFPILPQLLGLDRVLFIPFPPFLHGLKALWQPETPLLAVLGALALGLVWAVVFALLSLRAAEKEYARML